MDDYFSSSPILIKTWCVSEQEARRIGQALLDGRLIAAGHLSEKQSMYWWEDQQHQVSEWELSGITRAENFKAIEKVILSIHSYELPGIISIPITELGDDYLAWITRYTDRSS